MECIGIRCTKCSAKLADFVNLWTKIGISYVSPIVDPDGGLNVVSYGPLRPGEEGTLVANCELQDVACSSCRAVVGLKCLETPVNHVLHERQLMLRLTSISREAGEELKVQRALSLRDYPRNSSGGHPTSSQGGSRNSAADDFEEHSRFVESDLRNIQDELDVQRNDIQRIDSAGYQIVSAFNNAVLRIEGEVKRLKDGLSGLQRDLSGHQTKSTEVEDDISLLKTEFKDVKTISLDTSKFTHLEDGIAAAREAISSVREDITRKLDASQHEYRVEHNAARFDLDETRKELTTLRKELEDARNIARESISVAKGHTRVMLSLRAEMKQVREEAARDRSRKPAPGRSVFPAQELDILTANVTKIGNRASQVETLQMEFQLLKGRVQRMEAENKHAGLFQHETNRQPPDERLEASRKRRSESHHPEILDNESTLVTPPAKRPALSAWPSSPTRTYDSISSPQSMLSIGANSKGPGGLRLTKLGIVDKRCLRRS